MKNSFINLKQARKYGFCVLSLFFLFVGAFFLPLNAADSDFVIKNGTLEKYNGTAATVYVPAGVKKIGEDAFQFNSSIKKVVLPEGVTEIEKCAFYENENLVEIVLPSSIRIIRGWGIYNPSVKKLNLPEGLYQLEGCAITCSAKTLRLPKSLKKLSGNVFGFNVVSTLECYKGTPAFTYLSEYYPRLMSVVDAVNISKTTVTLSQSAFEYTGYEIEPKLTISWNGKKLKAGSYSFFDKDLRDADLSFSDNTDPGTAKITITARPDLCKGKYTGKRTIYFKIIPRTVKALSSGNTTTDKKVVLSWRNQKEATGYFVERLEGSAWKVVKRTNKNVFTDTKVKADTLYQYRVRAYTVVQKKRVYGNYSPVLEVKTNPSAAQTQKTAAQVKKGQSFDVSYTDTLISSGLGTDNAQYGTYVNSFSDNKDRYCVAYHRGDYLYIVKYGVSLKQRASIKIKKVLPLVGTVGCDSSGYLYVVYGKDDTENAGNVIVLAVSKYSPTGRLIKTLSIRSSDVNETGYSLNSVHITRFPFDAGTCVIAFSGKTLICNMAREMYNGHQSNTTLRVNTRNMTLIENGNQFYNYVSHSFNQDVLVTKDNTSVLFMNHGDAYPRGFSIEREPFSKENTNDTSGNSEYLIREEDSTEAIPFHFYGELGDNWTGAKMGNIIETSSGFMYCGAARKSMTETAASQRMNAFVQLLSKDDLSTRWNASRRSGSAGSYSYTDKGILWLTNYSGDYYATDVRLVEIDANRILVMWSKISYSNGSLLGSYCAILSPNGKILQKTTSLGYMYIGGKPVYKNGYVFWTGGRENTRDDKDYTMTYVDNIRTYRLKVTELTSIKVGKVSGFKVYYDPYGYNDYVSYIPLYFSWDRQIWADGYEIWRSIGTRGRFTRLINVKGNNNYLTNTYVKDTSPKKNMTYRYAVRAYRLVNGKKVYGRFSNIQVIKT